MLKNYEEIKNNFLNKEVYLSNYATKSENGYRLNKEKEDFRPCFFHDLDRIIHSPSYTRYTNKTQVFSFNKNDHIQTRIIHVNLVSKIARTIGRALNLNEDLIEAIGIGHDIGHTPIGHLGERILNDISLRETKKEFHHNIHGVRNYMYIENRGEGSNLTIQVLDGIMCHNGEVLDSIYKPVEKTKEEFLKEFEDAYYGKAKLIPMTLEGCVVRISDVISYVGRDIEDAIKLGFINREDIPQNIKEVLGDNNKDIVNNLIVDIINNSLDCPYIKFSKNVFKALKDLITFNYANIYMKANSKETIEYYDKVFNTLYNVYLNDLKTNNQESIFITRYLQEMNDYYLKNTTDQEKVIDFIAGMTDEYLISSYENLYCK